MAIAFLLLDFWPSIRAWADINFLGHILARAPTLTLPLCINLLGRILARAIWA